MQIPLIGELTPMRLFFLMMVLYSNDSSSLGTWCSIGAGMLLGNLCELLKQDKPTLSQLILPTIITVAVLLYSHFYQQQTRMMIFLVLQALIMPIFKFKLCWRMVDDKKELDGTPLVVLLPLLIISLYLLDGLSGLTSGVLFIIVLPECTARLPRLLSLKSILFYTFVLSACAPIVFLVHVAVNNEKEFLQRPPEEISMVKRGPYERARAQERERQILGARPETTKDYYAVIGVRRGADTAEIKKMFREASKLYHPDKTAGDLKLQEKFVAITEAVRKLTGKKTDREAYFRELENAELQDLVTRAVYFSLLFGLWLVMTTLSLLSRRDPGKPGDAKDALPPPPPPPPPKPLSRLQVTFLLLSVPLALAWLAVEAIYADDGPLSESAFDLD